MDMTGYLVTDLFVGLGAGVGAVLSASCGSVGTAVFVGAAGVGMEWRKLLMSTDVSRIAGGRLSLLEAWLGGIGCPQQLPATTKSTAATLQARLDRFTPCWSECIAYGLEAREDCHGQSVAGPCTCKTGRRVQLTAASRRRRRRGARRARRVRRCRSALPRARIN